MDAVESYFYDFEGSQQAVMLQLHHLLGEQLGLLPKIRYKIPFYYHRSWVCYLNPVTGQGVELVFMRGNELSDPNGLLDHRGRKQVAGIIFYTPEGIAEEPLYELLQEALLLDETVPYASKRKQ